MCVLKIEAHTNPIAFSYGLCELKKHGLLTLSNINLLDKYTNPQAITSALAAIPETLATQENLNKLFELKNIEFLAYSGYLLYRIPENKFNQTVFDKLMELSTKKNSSQEIYNFINKLLRNENPSNNNFYSSKNCLSQENEINLPTLELKR